MWGPAVIRIVWPTILFIVAIGAMVAIKAGSPEPPANEGASPDQNEGVSPDQRAISTGFSQDTLTRADKLEVAYVGGPAAIALVENPSGETPAQAVSPTPALKIVSRHWHDPNAKRPAVVAPDRRVNRPDPKKNKNTDRAKTTVELKPCRRPEGFGALLRALNLSPECET
jgi:hypothetical protein